MEQRQQLHAALLRAFEKADRNQSKFARAIGTTQQNVWYWLNNQCALPAEYVLAAEAAGLGSRYELRPDLHPRENAA